MATREALRHFLQMGTVLHIAAHPDDENTQLITYLARGRGYRTAYLSLTRGDGGQNEIGAEFDEKLGVLRTQELLAARRIDGGRQFFTRAIDFGFSKSPEETLRIWDKQKVLADVVRVIRTFRPDILITRFPVPPGSGGHGHHTASAMLAVEAFRISGDPKAFPEQIEEGLQPWQPKRVLWNGGDGRGGIGIGGAPIQVDIAGTDPDTGESFSAMAGRSRAMHKSQGFGNFGGGNGGPNVQNFTLLAGESATGDIMDGIDTTWSRVDGGSEIGRLGANALAGFNTNTPSASVPALLEIRAKLSALPKDPVIEDKRLQLDDILKACLGLSVETTVTGREVSPGESVKLHHTVTLLSPFPVRWISVRYPTLRKELSAGFTVLPDAPVPLDSTQTLPRGYPLTHPYWLLAPGSGGAFRVDDARLIGRPENPPSLPVEFVFEIAGQTLVVDDQPFARDAGNPSQPLAVIAPVALHFDTSVALFAPGKPKTIEVEVTAARGAASGTLQLEIPQNWQAAPDKRTFQLKETGAKTRLQFTVTANQTATGTILAVADVGGSRFTQQHLEIHHRHVPVLLLQPPARIKAVSGSFSVRGTTVGYLPGAGDDTVASLKQLGYTVRILSGTNLNEPGLRGLDAVVIGVRAFNERSDLASNLPALFDFVTQGGTIVAQYNRPNGLKTERLGPYPLSISGNAPQWRVTDEQAAVTLLAPHHPALTQPNRIVAEDFDGWVQERGAYFPSSWDKDHYIPLLAMSDPGESPLTSSILVAQHGKGYFVYTGLAFFRQLPAGVPGAYRLFANLVSLGK
jgi:LmbE family N-acetylglucosaminyl deacetylase